MPINQFETWWNATQAERDRWDDAENGDLGLSDADLDILRLTPGVAVNGDGPLLGNERPGIVGRVRCRDCDGSGRAAIVGAVLVRPGAPELIFAVLQEATERTADGTWRVRMAPRQLTSETLTAFCPAHGERQVNPGQLRNHGQRGWARVVNGKPAKPFFV